MVVFDSAVLLLFVDPNAKSDIDQAAKRIGYLIETLTADGERIIIPTPVLSEILVHAGTGLQGYLDALTGSAAFRIAPFDQKAAIECALAIKDALERGGWRVDAADPGATAARSSSTARSSRSRRSKARIPSTPTTMILSATPTNWG